MADYLPNLPLAPCKMQIKHTSTRRGRSLIRYLFRSLPLSVCSLLATTVPARACTSIIVTRGASADGSVIITYCCDMAGLYG